MSYSEKKADGLIRSYIKEKKMNLPESYKTMVKNQVEYYMEDYRNLVSKKKNLFYPSRFNKWVATFIIICVVAAAAGGAYAAINYVQQRMQDLSEEDKDIFAEQATYANADSFSRILSDEEKARMEILMDKYQNEGLFPEGEVYQITDTDEIISDRVCFLPETSTFYLPEGKLSDEQLLELIDFRFKREYSLLSQDVTDEYQQVSEITEEEAIRLSGEKLERVYGINTESMNMKIEYEQALDGDHNTFTTDYITFSADENSSQYYFAAVNLQDGHVDMLNYGDNDVSDYSDSVIEDTELYRELYDAARSKASSYLGSKTLISGRIEYLVTDNRILNSGIINYVFETSENNYCVISYSCARSCFYQIRSFTEEEQNARNQSNTEMAKNRNLEYVIIDM